MDIKRLFGETKMERLSAAVWLLIGFLLIPFTILQNVIPLAAWFAPIFLLRFARSPGRARMTLIFLAYAVGIFIATHSLMSSDVPLAIAQILVVPVFRGIMYSLPYRADRLIGSRLGTWGRLLVFPLAFTTVDWVLSLLRATTSAGSPAYSQYDNLALMQVVSITGMWGLTFLIAWFATTVNLLWEHHFEWRPVRSQILLFAAVLLVAFIFGSARLTFAAPSAQTVQVATITLDDTVYQAAHTAIDWMTFYKSTDQERAAVRPKFEATVDQMLARTETALRGGAKIVSWQEEAGFVLEEDKQSVLDRAAALAKQYDAYIEVALGVFKRTTALPYVLNQSILIDNTGNIRWTYDKTHPVFLGEDFVTADGIGRLPVLDTPYGRLSAAICNDMNFPALIRQAGQNNVDILITPYNDADGFAMADAVTGNYRAIENGVSLLRATGGGFSTITDYEGRILGSQDYFVASNSGIVLTTVPRHGVTTIYSRIGDLFAYLCAAGLIVLAGWAFFHRKQPTTMAQRQPV